MLRYLLLSASGCLLFASLAGAQGYPNIAPTEPKTPEQERQTFKLPPGFEAQLVASEPDIRKPIQMAFDGKGRLWVTTSEEYPFAARGRPGKDRLYVLEGFGLDGKAKKVSIFADDLNIPIGVLPLPDGKSVIVSSIDPEEGKDGKLTCWIWKLTDTDGDGKYDKKEKLYGPFGCDDTHGMNNSYTLMPDGWVYACHGFRNDSRPKGKDGHEIFMNSGNTFRFRPDGSHIEVWTRGQVNPFGIAVDPFFNLYTADCHSKPITQLIHGATYTSFSKPHDGLGFAPHVTIHGHESTALCGLVYYAANHFPLEYENSMFLGNVTSNCINLDKIEFNGSTPKAIDKGMFLASSDIWFRPTDIKLGPDGALYFADFYNRIIGHYEVALNHPGRDKLRGRVWRIVYRGVDGNIKLPKFPPDLTKADSKQLFDLLGSPNLTVRLLVLNQMIHRGADVMTGLTPTPDELAEGNRGAYFLWLQGRFRLGSFVMPGESFFQALDESHPLVTVHAIKSHDAFDLAYRFRLLLTLKDARARQAAVEGLAARATSADTRPLLEALAKCEPADTHLHYALRVALREATASLIDWDKAADADSMPWTDEQIKALMDVAAAVTTPGAAEFLDNHIREVPTDSPRLATYVEHAVRYGSDDNNVRKDLVEFIDECRQKNARLAVSILIAYQQGLQKRGEQLDKPALALAEKFVAEAATKADSAELQLALELATAFKLAAALKAPWVGEVAAAKSRPESLRAAALAALATADPANAMPILAVVLHEASEPITLREKAAQSLAAMNRDDAYQELVKAFKAAPARLQTVMAVALASKNQGAEILLKAIEKGEASARLLQDVTVKARLNDRKQPKMAERIAALTKGLPSADEKMAKLMVSRRNSFNKAKPDPMLGKQVFTKNCANCHQIGNEGNKIGPQLDGIGGRGLDRLLEDVLDPNRNVDAAFRTTVVTLTDGKNISGLALREEGQVLVLADDKGKEVRIEKKDIEEKRTSLLSPMPANLVETITEKEFLDLMAYLLTQKAKEKKGE
jgi:putative heme-binding domain-containing protein